MSLCYSRRCFSQSFKQHASESDEERVQQIMEQALLDAKWVIQKVDLRYGLVLNLIFELVITRTFIFIFYSTTSRAVLQHLNDKSTCCNLHMAN